MATRKLGALPYLRAFSVTWRSVLEVPLAQRSFVDTATCCIRLQDTAIDPEQVVQMAQVALQAAQHAASAQSCFCDC